MAELLFLCFGQLCHFPHVSKRVSHPASAVGAFPLTVTQRAAAVGTVGGYGGTAAGEDVAVVDIVALLQYVV